LELYFVENSETRQSRNCFLNTSDGRRGNLEKADQHFRDVLGADASRGLDKATYHYLANIKHKQGFEERSKNYAKAYFNIK